MSQEERFALLWNDYLEGELDERGVAELQALLEADEGLLRSAADSYRTHRLLGLLVRSGASAQEEFVQGTMARLPADGDALVDQVMERIRPGSSRARHRSVAPWAIAIAAAAVLIAVLVTSWWPGADPKIVRVVEFGGAVQWTGDGGQVEGELGIGLDLGGGTLESFSPDAWAVLEFRDGSKLTTSGPSMLTVSERGQKVLHLRRGRLSADVRPQGDGQPMLLHTPTAELEVLGTQFNVEAEPLMTSLTVNEGRVRLTRLADGRATEVPADHVAVATEDPEDDLTAVVRQRATPTWRGDLKEDVTHGKWVSDLEFLAKKLKIAVMAGEMTALEAKSAFKDAAELENGQGRVYAVPLVLGGKKTPDSPRTLYLVAISASREPDRPVALVPGARLRVEGQMRFPTEIVFGLSTEDPSWGKFWKFEVSKQVELTDTQKRSFVVNLPLDEFRCETTSHVDSPVGQELRDAWCYTTVDAGLEIVRIELLPPDSAENR